MKKESKSIIINANIKSKEILIDWNFLLFLNWKKLLIFSHWKNKPLYELLVIYKTDKEIICKEGTIFILELFFEKEVLIDKVNNKQKEFQLKNKIEDILPLYLEKILHWKVKLIKREYKVKTWFIDFLYSTEEQIILVEVKIGKINTPSIRQILWYNEEIKKLWYKKTFLVLIGNGILPNVVKLLKEKEISFVNIDDIKI